jgi:predicted aspartyl protease
LVDAHIVIPVKVNGSRELNMVLDTGFGSPGAILLDPAIGESLGLEYTTPIPLGGGGGDETGSRAGIATGATLSLSGLQFTGQQVMVIQDGELFENLYVAGIIGATLFDYIVVIDYEESVLSLYEERPEEPSQLGHEFKLDYSFGIPVVDASLAVEDDPEVPVRLLVDTGVNFPLLVFTFSDDRLKEPDRVIKGIEGVLSEGMSGKILGTTGRVQALKLGPYEIRDVVASFPTKESWGPAMQLGQNGMLGNEVLQRFDVVFDYGENRMFLSPNGGYARPTEYNMAGLVLRAEKDVYEILDVIRESAAQEQGIRSGDRLVAIDDRPLSAYPTHEVRRIFSREGSTVELTVERGEERFERTLVLKRLI